MQHDLKTWPAYFRAVKNGDKPFEMRLADRDYNTGDVLHLREWNPETKEYTGEDLYRIVTYIMRGPAFGLKEGWVCMGIRE